MNILILGSRIIYGGGEKVLNWLAHKLIENGHNVIFSTPKADDSYFDKLNLVGLINSVEVVEYPHSSKKSNMVSYYRYWKNLLRNKKVDILLIFGGSLIEQLAALSVGVHVVLSERCEPASRPFLSRLLKQIQYRFASGYVFQTPEASFCYGKRAHKRSIVIPNPIIDKLPEPEYVNLRKEIVSVGRLSPEKNQLMLIKAFAEFVKIYPEYKLIIYGDGPLKAFLQEQVNYYKITDNVRIVSGKRNISELIKGAELFVLPSNTEGMPNALIEAMSMGLLCISTDCPIFGPRMLVRNGDNGYLTPIKNHKLLLKQMLSAVEDKEGSMKIRYAAVEIRDTLNSKKIAENWLNYFNKVLES